MAWAVARVDPAARHQRDTIADPARVGKHARVALEVRDVEKEARGAGNVGLDQAIRGFPRRKPAAAGSIEIHARIGQGSKDRDRAAQLRVSRFGRTAILPLRPAIFDRSIERPVPGNDAKAVGFENDDRLSLPDARRETLDPRKISRAIRCAAGRIERAVPERNVIGYKDGNLPRGRCAIYDLADLDLDHFRRAIGKPRRRCDAGQKQGVTPRLAIQPFGSLFRRAVRIDKDSRITRRLTPCSHAHARERNGETESNNPHDPSSEEPARHWADGQLVTRSSRETTAWDNNGVLNSRLNRIGAGR